MLCEKVGLNIWFSFKSEVTEKSLVITTNFLKIMNHNAEVTQLRGKVISEHNKTLNTNLRFECDN